MTREKGYFYNIPKFYRFQTLDHICFGYVQGLRSLVTTMTVTDAIKTFLNDFDLCEDVYCFDNARAAYYKIKDSIVEIKMGFDPE
jgi:hypothetical protein